MEKKQLPRKWAGKKTTAAEEKAIEAVKAEMQSVRGKPVAWLEAKHNYFESVEDNDSKAAYKRGPGSPLNKPSVTAAKDESTSVDPAPAKKKKVIGGTWMETKLGVTLVISKDDCRELGFDKGLTTREVVRRLRTKLGLKNKEAKQ